MRKLRIDRNLIMLMLVNIVLQSCWNSVVTFFPLYLQERGAQVFDIGFVQSIQYLFSIVFTFLSGLLADKSGYKKPIALSLVMMAASTLSYTFTHTWEQVIPLAVIFMSSFYVFVPPRFLMVSRIAKSENLTVTLGIMGISWPLAFLIGPLFGGYVIENYGWNNHFHLVTYISLTCLIPVFFMDEITDQKGRIHDNCEIDAKSKTLGSMKGLLSGLLVFCLYSAFVYAATRTIYTFIPIYLTEVFQTTRSELSVFFSIGQGIGTLITQIPAGILGDRYGRRNVMAFCLSTLPVWIILLPWLGNYILLMFFFTLTNILWSLSWPPSESYMIGLVPHNVGFGMSLRMAAMQVGGMFGPLIGGFMWMTYGNSACFYSSALFFLIGCLFVLLLEEKPKNYQSENL